MMTKTELQRRVDALKPWHYCHIFPHNISTGTCRQEYIGDKMMRLIGHDAFPKATYPNVLDLGANSGMISMWFVDNKQSKVMSIERGERYYPQLELAIEAKGYTGKIVPMRANICDLGFGEEWFDLVLFLGTLHHVGHRKYHRPILEACYTALKPGGEMVVQTRTDMPVMHLLRAAKFIDCTRLYTHGDRAAWKGWKA
jgi:2-polyprenyl-3-methyl-5-hydroxy-6-metoxy-1,4-benzoquinol methylase